MQAEIIQKDRGIRQKDARIIFPPRQFHEVAQDLLYVLHALLQFAGQGTGTLELGGGAQDK